MMDSLREKLVNLLPILMMGMIGLGLTVFAAKQLVPAWKDYESLAGEVETSREAAARIGSEGSANPIILASRVEGAQEQRQAAAAVFLSEDEADQIMDLLYGYAEQSGVQIVNLKAQQTDQTETSAANTVFDARVFQLQVNGDMPSLMRFITRIREATLPGFALTNVNIGSGETGSTLTFDALIYTSPFASGDTLAGAVDVALPTVVPTILPDSGTPAPTADPSGLIALYPAAPVLSLPASTADAGSDSLPPCPGAPETLFKVGDMAVVDFNEVGALRILAQVGGSVLQTRAQAYDNQQLTILGGPACGTAGQANVWFWYVQREGFGDYTGWAAEATLDDRWMCPAHNPECSD